MSFDEKTMLLAATRADVAGIAIRCSTALTQVRHALICLREKRDADFLSALQELEKLEGALMKQFDVLTGYTDQ